MRKVAIRWKISSLENSKDISQILAICEKLEILGHLAVNPDGVDQLAEVKLLEGKTLDDLSALEHFEVLQEHEDSEEGKLIRLRCTHPLAKTAIELSNIQVVPPYGIDSVRGMEMRIAGLSGSIRRFTALLRLALPPDTISVQSYRAEANGAAWSSVLTDRQREVLHHAIKHGFYDIDRDVTLKQLAESLGMARSTYGEHIRRAESEVMKKIFDDLL